MAEQDGANDKLLSEIRARLQIEQCHALYIRGQDRGLPDIQRQAFHDDAFVDAGFFAGGPDDYVAFAQRALSRYESTHHQIGHPAITIDGDRGQGETYFSAWHRLNTPEGPQDVIISGRYIDEYSSKNGEWKIAKRAVVMDWGQKLPASDDFLGQRAGIWRGQRGNDDFGINRAWRG